MREPISRCQSTQDSKLNCRKPTRFNLASG
jgi:hypothetical protein